MRVIACPINTHFLFLSSFWHEVQKRVQSTILRPNLTFHNPHGQWIGCTPIMFTILLLSRSQMSTAFGGSCCLRGGESIFFFSLFWNLWHQCEWVECRLHRCTTHAGGIWRAPVEMPVGGSRLSSSHSIVGELHWCPLKQMNAPLVQCQMKWGPLIHPLRFCSHSLLDHLSDNNHIAATRLSQPLSQRCWCGLSRDHAH